MNPQNDNYSAPAGTTAIYAGRPAPATEIVWRRFAVTGADVQFPDGIRAFSLQQPDLPIGSEWVADQTDHGLIVTPGATQDVDWDWRLGGSISPCCCIKAQDVYYLYYVGADGNRTVGGAGPKNRKIGVAISDNGVNWTKYAGNPIGLTYPVGEEAGAFSAAAMLDPTDGKILLYYAVGFGTVQHDIYLAVIDPTDGVTVESDVEVANHNDAWVTNNGDEIFPVGCLHDGAEYHVYYIGKGNAGAWDLNVMSSASRDFSVAPSSQQVLGNSPNRIGGCDVMSLGDGTSALVLLNDFATYTRETRTLTDTAPESLSAAVDSYTFADEWHETSFRDLV